MRKEFSADTPELAVVLLDTKSGSGIESHFQKKLNENNKNIVALAIYVSPANIKHLLTAIKLMDVQILFVTKKHKKYFKGKCREAFYIGNKEYFCCRL